MRNTKLVNSLQQNTLQPNPLHQNGLISHANLIYKKTKHKDI